MIETILETVGRTAVIYIVILVGLRILGKRHVAQLSLIDLVLILLISNAVQNAMVGSGHLSYRRHHRRYYITYYELSFNMGIVSLSSCRKIF